MEPLRGILTNTTPNARTRSKKLRARGRRRKANKDYSVHFSEPIQTVEYVSMSTEAKEARMSDWYWVAIDARRFRFRIKQTEPEISRCLEEAHRERIRNYIQDRLQNDTEKA